MAEPPYNGAVNVSGFGATSVPPASPLSRWIHSHVRAFEFFAGTSPLVVPDNWRAAASTVNRPAYIENAEFVYNKEN
jgi:transposase